MVFDNIQIDRIINSDICDMLTYTRIFPSSVLKGPRGNDTPVAMNTPSAQILVSKCHSQIKGTRCCLNKWLMSELRQEKYE